MNCEEFWEKSAEYIINKDGFPSDLQEHISNCDICREEFITIREGLMDFNRDIRQEMPSIFWHEMKENISRNIKTPPKIWSFNKIRNLFLIPSLVVSVFLIVFTFFNNFNEKKYFYNLDTPSMILSGLSIEDMLIQQWENSSINGEFNFVDFNLDSYMLGGVTDDLGILLLDDANKS